MRLHLSDGGAGNKVGVSTGIFAAAELAQGGRLFLFILGTPVKTPG
jgi:hypothetical protein